MIVAEHEDNGQKGRFFVKDKDDYLAQMVYLWAGKDKIIIEHTEVDERLKGQGAGRELLAALVAWARNERLKIIPLCPFAKATMEKNPGAYSDVLYHQGT